MKKLLLPLALLSAAPAAAQEAEPVDDMACNEPVLMVVTGTTFDIDRMIAYARALADSNLYPELGGYYLNSTRAVAHFDGDAPDGHTSLVVRFPCLANAQAFWNSRRYQEDVLPLRLNPSAGDYIVRVYPEIPLRSDMEGRVGDNRYTHDFSNHRVEQIGN